MSEGLSHDKHFSAYVKSVAVFRMESGSPLSSLYPEASTCTSFEDVLELSKKTFDSSNVRDRALNAAQAMDGIDPLQVEADSLAFSQDPIGTLSRFATLSASSKLSLEEVSASCSRGFSAKRFVIRDCLRLCSYSISRFRCFDNGCRGTSSHGSYATSH